jgi:TPR repeat protein
MISTDLELASAVSEPIGQSYKEAVEFTTVLPSYSLIRYRDVLEGICNLIAKEHGLVADSISLFEKINELAERGAITFGFKDRCHRLRKLCNPGAHRRSSSIDSQKKDEIKAEHEQLRSNAQEGRDVALWIIEYYYRSVAKVSGELNYLLVEIQTQEWKDLLFYATTDGDAQTKFKAGLWCEAEAEKRELEFNGIIAPTEFEHDQNFLKRLAATFHFASYQATRNIDAGFRYAQFVVQKKIDTDKLDEARKLIEEAAKAGHGEACDYHASILYDDEQDYAKAEKFWLIAAQRNVTRAFSCLYFYYTEGKACTPNPEKAVAFVEKGVAQDCRDCLYSLGRAYFEGEFVQKDDDKARELLARASELGHGIARGYLLLMVNGGMDVIAEEFAKIGRMLAAIDTPHQEVKVVAPDPYSPCECGSGKKHKWCCMSKATEQKPSRSPLAQFLPRF